MDNQEFKAKEWYDSLLKEDQEKIDLLLISMNCPSLTRIYKAFRDGQDFIKKLNNVF